MAGLIRRMLSKPAAINGRRTVTGRLQILQSKNYMQMPAAAVPFRPGHQPLLPIPAILQHPYLIAHCPYRPLTDRKSKWYYWHVEDQRFVTTRPDVVSFTGDTLTADLTVTGQITAHLLAATSGTDADWIVKLIDVYPNVDTESPYHERLPAPGSHGSVPRTFQEGFFKTRTAGAGKT